MPPTSYRAGGDIPPGERPDGKAVIGVTNRKPFVELNGRKRSAVGPRIVWTCISEAHTRAPVGFDIPRLFCPSYTLWPAIVGLSHAGCSLFLIRSNGKVPDDLRSLGGAKGRKSAEGIGTQSLRSGEARAILGLGVRSPGFGSRATGARRPSSPLWILDGRNCWTWL